MEEYILGLEVKNCKNGKKIYIDSKTAMKMFNKKILKSLDFDTESIFVKR